MPGPRTPAAVGQLSPPRVTPAGEGASVVVPVTAPGGRAGSAGLSELAGKQSQAASRVGSASHTPKGVLPTYLFANNEGSASDVEKKIYAFQPRRQAVLTPGEETLVSRRPHSSAGRMVGSKSAVGLLSRSPAPGQPPYGEATMMRPLRA